MLFSALSVSNTGIQAASTFLDVVGNNIANSSTTGFKNSAISFADLLYNGPPAGLTAPGLQNPQGLQLGSGTATADIVPIFTQGTLTPTGQPFDLAITGQGFFTVTLPDGSNGYTRAGNFNLDASGQVVTDDGFILDPGIVVPSDATSVSVGADGTVVATTPSGNQTLGQIPLANFPNPQGLVRIGDTLFVPGPASGAAVTGVPGTQGLGTLSQGFLEGSNVELANELVNLIIAQRAFTFNTEALTAENITLQATADLIPLG